jgi:nitrite reductase (NO-forming)
MRTRFLLPVTLILGAALLAGCASSSRLPSWTYAPSTDAPDQGASAGGAPGHASHEPAPPAAPAEAGGTIDVTSFDMGFEPAELSVPAPGTYTVNFKNTGTIPHDITFPGGETASANAGETVSVDFAVPAEGLSFICSIPGHEQAGMSGKVAVEGAAASPAPAADDHGGPMAETDVQADPNAPAPVTHDPVAPKLPRARSTTSIS